MRRFFCIGLGRDLYFQHDRGAWVDPLREYMQNDKSPSFKGNAALEAELSSLDAEIRKLKVLYDQFFVGALPYEPAEQRKQIEAKIQRWTKKGFSRYADRFRFNGLVTRFNSFSELWGRNTRAMEEGHQRAPTLAEKFNIREHLITRCNVRNPDEALDELRRLHSRYLSMSPEGAKTPSFENFKRVVGMQTDKLRKQSGCDQIELRLVVRDEKVHVKARPGK